MQGLDGVIAPVAGARVDDGCEPLTIDATGKMVLMYRGVCAFTVKVKNAQNAGAKAAIIANSGTPGNLFEFRLGGADPTITIPSIGIGFADGDAIVAGSPGAVAAFYVDTTRLAGTTDGYVRLYAPRTVAVGSSISHYDITATPNLLMEPAITGSLRAQPEPRPDAGADAGHWLAAGDAEDRRVRHRCGECAAEWRVAARRRRELRSRRGEPRPVRKLRQQSDERSEERWSDLGQPEGGNYLLRCEEVI